MIEKWRPSGHPISLVIGGAECVWDDLDDLEAMMGGPWPGLVVVCNDMAYKAAVCPERHIGRRWTGPLHHWTTLHAEKMGGWKRQREQAGLDMNFATWSAVNRTIIQYHFEGWKDGSSGLYATGVVLKALRIPKALLCGVAMDGTKNTFTGREWASHHRYQKGWTKNRDALTDRVRSMSGWTRLMFGAPTLDWIGLVPSVEPKRSTPPLEENGP